DPDVFDYCPTSCERGDTLFSVEPVAPAQGDAKLAVWRAAALRAAVALGVTLILLLVAAPAGAWRWLVVLVAAWCAASAPLGLPGRAAELFSPAVFYRSALGAFSASAGSLAVLGVVALLAASALWRRGLERRWWHVTGAALLVLAAPYLVRYLVRGIARAAGGAGFALWMAWEAAVAGAAMALILGAAALVRGPAEPARVPWALPVACVWAALAGLAGLWLWNPYGAWPEWYTFVWLPALVGVLVPAPRRWAVLAIATVAGTAAALVTWGAVVEGRLRLAERDSTGESPRGPPGSYSGRALCALSPARLGRGADGGGGSAHSAHSGGARCAVPRRRARSDAPLSDLSVPPLARAARRDRSCDLDARRLVGAWRAADRTPRRRAACAPAGGLARPVGAGGARRVGRVARRGPARRVL